jgi:hypothetical protein
MPKNNTRATNPSQAKRGVEVTRRAPSFDTLLDSIAEKLE